MIKKSKYHGGYKSFFNVLFCSSGSSSVEEERSGVFLCFFFFFLHLLHLLRELLEEVLPQVGELVSLCLVRVPILFQLEEPFEKLEIVLLLLQSLVYSFRLLAAALATKDAPRKEVDQTEGRRECRARSEELSL